MYVVRGLEPFTAHNRKRTGDGKRAGRHIVVPSTYPVRTGVRYPNKNAVAVCENVHAKAS